MNWETENLGTICNIEIGGTPSRKNLKFWDIDKKTNNVWLSIADMNNTKDLKVNDSIEYLSNEGAKKVRIVKKGTLLMSFKLTVGRLAFAKRDLRTNEAIAALNIKDENKILKKYLYYYFLYFNWDINSENTIKLLGKTLNKNKLNKIKINYPKIKIQKDIIVQLDNMVSETQKIIKIQNNKFIALKNLINSHAKNLINY